MTRTRLFAALAGLMACLALVAALPPLAHAGEDKDEATGWTVQLKTKTMYNSHTSYEFKNPYPPKQLLSRLKFPLDSVWTGFEARKDSGRFSTGVEFLSSVGSQHSGHMEDSDWDDDTQPGRLTNYSETRTSLLASFQAVADIDMQVADLIGLPAGFILRPVAGLRWQRFSFMTHEGTQYDYPAAGLPTPYNLAGDTIAFTQNWYMPFAGLRLGYEWTNLAWPKRVKLSTQADLSYVVGRNHDVHRLRGDRTTDEHTTGSAWHGLAGVEIGLTEHLDLGLEADYLRIESTGSHKLEDSGYTLTWSDGVRAWSEQSSLTLKLGYRF